MLPSVHSWSDTFFSPLIRVANWQSVCLSPCNNPVVSDVGVCATVLLETGQKNANFLEELLIGVEGLGAGEESHLAWKGFEFLCVRIS